jgi:hypothetical protein
MKENENDYKMGGHPCIYRLREPYHKCYLPTVYLMLLLGSGSSKNWPFDKVIHIF